MIRIQTVSKKFGDLKVVDRFSHKLEKGKITALVGPNGAGKTTLFNIITGIIRCDKGKIFFGKKEITNMKTFRIANLGVSFIFQQNAYFKNLSIKDHLLLCSQSPKKTRNALRLTGLNKPLKSIAFELSYGQKKLLGLTMALLKKHKVLLLDEPVAGVNPALKNQIKKVLLSLKKQGETIFLIEHDMGFVKSVADEVIVLENGKILAKGTYSEIMKNKKVLKTFIGLG